MIESDILTLGETWLQGQSEVSFNGFEGHFASFGRGKGIAVFSRHQLYYGPSKSSSECHSVIKVVLSDIELIFVYVSQNCDRKALLSQLFDYMDLANPTVVMGDFNEKYCESSYLSKSFKRRGFSQLISSPTHDKGNLIDHMYVNNLVLERGHFVEKSAAYYSDHDILTLYIKK